MKACLLVIRVCAMFTITSFFLEENNSVTNNNQLSKSEHDSKLLTKYQGKQPLLDVQICVYQINICSRLI